MFKYKKKTPDWILIEKIFIYFIAFIDVLTIRTFKKTSFETLFWSPDESTIRCWNVDEKNNINEKIFSNEMPISFSFN